MRSELEQLEQIDQYLSGQMSADQSAAFEAQMDADPALKSVVQDQQLLIQTVSRKALMAEINSVAGLVGAGASAGWGIVQWAITGVSIVGVTIGGIFIYDAVTDSPAEPNQIQPKQLIVADQNEEIIVPAHDTAEYKAFPISVEEEALEDNETNDTDESDKINNDSNLHQYGSDKFIKAPTLGGHNPLEQKSQLSDTQNHNGHDLSNKETKEVKLTDNTFKPKDNSEYNIQKSQKAHFTGGNRAMIDWFSENLVYPGTPRKEKLQGTVKVSFLVNPDGSLSHINADCFVIKNDQGALLTSGFQRLRYSKSIKAFERQVLHTFRKNPNWVPATNTNGTAVVSEEVWFVNFILKGHKAEVYPGFDDEGFLYEYETESELNTQDKKELNPVKETDSKKEAERGDAIHLEIK